VVVAREGVMATEVVRAAVTEAAVEVAVAATVVGLGKAS